MIYGIIYKYTSPSGKIYIGQTKYTVEHRIKQHINDANNGSTKLFHIAIRKYGIETFNYEILNEAFSIEELNKLEIYYIEKYNSYYKNGNGYNMTIGGEGANGYIFTENDRQKLSGSLKKYYINNPQSLIEMGERTKEYNRLHPEKQIKHSQFMQTYMNLPENKERTRNTFKQFREKNPNAISIQQKEIWKKDEYRELQIRKHKEYDEMHPEDKLKRIDRLKQSAKDNAENHSILMKQLSCTPEKIEEFKNLIKTDRENYPEKYDKAKEKRKDTMNKPEFKENMSKIKRKILKEFEVFDKDGILIGEFNNTIDCIKQLNLPKPPSIVLCLDNKIKQSCGYTFKYK